MVSLQVYKLVHMFGLFLLFTSVGGIALHAANGGTRDSNTARGLAFGTHGIGLLLVFVSGFGMLARLGMTAGVPGWAVAKLVIWLAIGGLVMLPQRAPGTAKAVWFGAPVLAAVAVWLAITKPF
ncbi:MAG: hypothetical protein ACI8PZ_003676 [Myxococcota bacterium]|jgi:hypothetical protein